MSVQLLWFATRGAGIVSLLFLTGVVYLGILGALRWQTPAWPRFATTGFHRSLSLLAVAFLGVHIVTAVVDPFTSLGWLVALVPFSSSYRTLWLGLGVLALDLGAAVLVTSLLRNRIGRRTWRAVHWLSYAAWPLALLHGLGTGTDATAPWMIAVNVTCLAVVGAAVLVRATAGRSRTPAAPIMAGMQRSNGAATGAATRPSARP
jgi:sulfoxide reductase heme-binding subunit YedZ